MLATLFVAYWCPSFVGDMYRSKVDAMDADKALVADDFKDVREGGRKRERKRERGTEITRKNETSTYVCVNFVPAHSALVPLAACSFFLT